VRTQLGKGVRGYAKVGKCGHKLWNAEVSNALPVIKEDGGRLKRMCHGERKETQWVCSA